MRLCIPCGVALPAAGLMHTPRITLSVIALAVAAAGLARQDVRAGAGQSVLTLDGDVSPVHDPVVIKAKGLYYVFCTGGRNGRGVLPIRTSPDMRAWKTAGFVFESLPEWVGEESADGAQCLGARHRVLQRQVPPLLLGVVVRQPQLRDRARHQHDARSVEPRLPVGGPGDGAALVSGQGRLERDRSQSVLDEDRAWLAWGSFWGGIKMRRLEPSSGKLSAADETMHSLSSRPREQPINGSVEAPFIVHHGDYWYLFVSFDRCCRGAESTYNVVVGRSRTVTGPYIDRRARR